MLNHMTGEKLEMKFIAANGAQNPSYVEGKAYDSNGVLKMEVIGSWMDEISVRDVQTGETEVVWREPEMLPDANLQYFYG